MANRNDPCSRGTALVIDDSRTARQMATHLLERAGYRVVAAEDGQEGYLEALRSRPDVVLLDIEMPRMGGIECCERIRSSDSLRRTRILMLTGRDDTRTAREAFDAGCDGYLTKPLQGQDLSDRLAELRRFSSAHHTVCDLIRPGENQ